MQTQQLSHRFCVLGSQGSTNFSYFPWASASVGYKWGQALPAYCMDERWVRPQPCIKNADRLCADKGVWNGRLGLSWMRGGCVPVH